jgi:4-hydroxybutyryl-CoA dehydratase/vinylacetyl-CoA-Delta-isomerase
MMTGQQYKESLNDGRATYFAGRRVIDFDEVPAFSTPRGHIADSYDLFYRPEPDAVNPMFQAPESKDELRDRIPQLMALDEVTYLTYQCQMTLTTAASRLRSVAPEMTARIDRYVADARRRDIRMVECITDAKGHRGRRPQDQDDQDAYVRVVERRDDGIVVRGAKLHITGTPLAHELLVMPTKAMKPGEEDYAVAFAVPMSAPGLMSVSTSFHPTGHPADYPVSGRLSLPDSFVIFDDVFVPYERVFLDGQTSSAAVFAHSLGLWERLGGTSLMVQQADEIAGLAQLIAEANGVDGYGHVREKIAELTMHATLLRAGLEAALANAERSEDGFYFPSELYTNAARYLAAAGFSAAVQKLQDIAGGSVATVPSMLDLDNPDVGPFVEKYMSTSTEVSGRYRVQLFHAIKDLTADKYGGWWHVVNLHSGGGLYAQRLITRKHYDMTRAKALARRVAGLPDEG